MARQRPEDVIAGLRQLRSDAGALAAELGLPDESKYRLLSRLSVPAPEPATAAPNPMERIRLLTGNVLPQLRELIDDLWAVLGSTSVAGLASIPLQSAPASVFRGPEGRTIPPDAARTAVQVASLFAWAEIQAPPPQREVFRAEGARRGVAAIELERAEAEFFG